MATEQEIQDRIDAIDKALGNARKMTRDGDEQVIQRDIDQLLQARNALENDLSQAQGGSSRLKTYMPRTSTGY